MTEHQTLHVEPHGLGDMSRHYIRDLVYGANDGIITTFAVVAGVAGGALSARRRASAGRKRCQRKRPHPRATASQRFLRSLVPEPSRSFRTSLRTCRSIASCFRHS